MFMLASFFVLYCSALTAYHAAEIYIPEFKDFTFLGSDLENVSGVDKDECYDLCDNKERCVAFTWSPYKHGTCWLKDKYTKLTQEKGSISSVKVELMEKTELRAQDTILTYTAPTIIDCVSNCVKHVECHGIRYSTSKVCSFTNNNIGIRRNSNFTSAIL